MKMAGKMGVIHSNSNLLKSGQHEVYEERDIITTQIVNRPLDVGAQIDVAVRVKVENQNDFYVGGMYIFTVLNVGYGRMNGKEVSYLIRKIPSVLS